MHYLKVECHYCIWHEENHGRQVPLSDYSQTVRQARYQAASLRCVDHCRNVVPTFLSSCRRAPDIVERRMMHVGGHRGRGLYHLHT